MNPGEVPGSDGSFKSAVPSLRCVPGVDEEDVGVDLGGDGVCGVFSAIGGFFLVVAFRATGDDERAFAFGGVADGDSFDSLGFFVLRGCHTEGSCAVRLGAIGRGDTRNPASEADSDAG